MSRSRTGLYARIGIITRAWSTYRPAKILSGLSLERFEAGVKACHDTRAELKKAKARVREILARRNEADREARKLVQRVVNAVKADPEEGEDSQFYVQMGYVARTVRNTLQGYRPGKKTTKPEDDET